MLRLLPLILCSGLVLYFQLKAEPALGSVRAIPVPVARFLDLHDFFKNAVGFAALAVSVYIASPPRDYKTLGLRALNLAGIVVVLEGAQIFLPLRSCDWRDVAAGWLGIGLVSGLWWGRLVFRP